MAVGIVAAMLSRGECSGLMRNDRFFRSVRIAAFALLFWIAPAFAGETELTYAPAPAANPLKGLVPYMGEREDAFPHSMEFFYLPFDELVVGPRRYDWAPLEKRLDAIAGRGRQAVFRIYLEYPKKPSAVPKHLRKGEGDTLPDYEDPKLRAGLRQFIADFGAKYDGDPRVGFITAGLLGKWGEWHTYPDTDRWASREVQEEVLNAYEAAFNETPVLLRYPVGEDEERNAPNTTRPFGYHDDSFAWATLHTGKKEDFWFYMTALAKAGEGALTKWRRYPIGGEIRPEAWGQVFDRESADERVQDFAECVRVTHATWLMDSGMFNNKKATKQRRARAEELVRKMGYEFHVRSARWVLDGERLAIRVQIENRGVAPFYAGWNIEWGLIGGGGEVVRSASGEADLCGIFPGGKANERSGRIGLDGLPAGSYRLAMRVGNPLPKGLPLRFANAEQDRHREGWLSLGEVEIGQGK